MYKLHKKEVINEHENQKTDYKPILIKDIFELPVKHNGKYAYGRKLYERTYTSKPQQQTAYTPTTTSIKINEFITELNKNTSQISTHDNIKDRICQNYSINTQTVQPTRYITPLQYKLEQNSITIYTLFGKCNSNQLESKTIPNIIHKFISSLSIILNGVNDKRTRETASYKQAKVTFEETSNSMKNRLYIEDMATALFYYSMYYTSQKTNPSNYKYGVGYGTGQYAYGGYGGYPRW